MAKSFLVIVIISLVSCKNNAQESKPRRATIPVENIKATKDQSERRKQSEDYCRLHHIPIYSNPNSLFVDPEAEVTTRTKDEVADRALAILYIGLKSEGLEKASLDEIDKKYGIMSRLSPEEKQYALAANPTEQQKVNANWRYEGLHVMLWALSLIDSLSYPDTVCDVAADVKIIHDMTEAQFRQKAKLRTKKEILDQADQILRIDWACVDARANGRPYPAQLNNDVVQERHHSLNWLIKYMGQDWDNVGTDT